ncbi:M-like protein [Deinococcus koreensis]|uniref:M-like protein n=1 Tax=Deinococcus koreensis TaxID=2054903 RepID=A0A2K3UUV1_9DEIO|nr:M-like protein [Deinococcus koreensis]PNY80316.1 M-like protein [Deinococcus koreensis]
MTHTPDQSQTDQAQLPKTEEEVSNVDLQFMGRTDPAQQLDAEVQAQSKAPGEFEQRGMDAQDVASAGSMIASDPASTSMPPEDEQ